jgi:hypothetical protein
MLLKHLPDGANVKRKMGIVQRIYLWSRGLLGSTIPYKNPTGLLSYSVGVLCI